MVREFRYWLEFTLLAAIQIFWIGQALVSLFPAAALGQPVNPVSAAPASLRLGAFMDSYPPDKSAELAPTQTLWQQHQSGITAYHLFKARKSFESMQRAGDSFGAECRGLGGKLQTSPEPGEIMYAYTLEKRLTRFDHVTYFCVSAEGKPLGGLFAYLFGGADRRSHVALFLISADHVAQQKKMPKRAAGRNGGQSLLSAPKPIAAQSLNCAGRWCWSPITPNQAGCGVNGSIRPNMPGAARNFPGCERKRCHSHNKPYRRRVGA